MISDLPCVIHDYTFFKLIGKGGFSSVYLVRSNRSDFLYCAKVTQIQNPDSKDEEWKTIDNEIKALTLLNHPNIVRLYDHFHDNAHFYIILEYCSGGNLQTQIPKNKGLALLLFKRIANQIISALATCHRNNIAHHDLKLGNVLLDGYKRVKLADFGISVKTKHPNELSDSYAGSIQYEAPEILNKVPHDPFKADIWALGVLFAHLITGQSPWRCDTIGKLKRCILTVNFSLRSSTPPELVDIIKQMIVIEPEKRLSMSDLVRNPFFVEEAKISSFPFLCQFKDCLCPDGRKIVLPSKNENTITFASEEEESPELTMEELTRMDESHPVSYKTSHVLAICQRNIKGSIGVPVIRTRYHSFEKSIPTFADNINIV